MILVTLKDADYNPETNKTTDWRFGFINRADADKFIGSLLEDDGLNGLDRESFVVEDLGAATYVGQTERFYGMVLAQIV